MKTICIILTSVVLLFSCKRTVDAPLPDTTWDLFESPGARPLSHWTRTKVEGIYSIEDGNDFFGTAAALKWSYTITGSDTLHHLSAFCQQDATYLVMEGRRLNGDMLFNGYWRRKVSDETGAVRLTISAANGSAALLADGTQRPATFVITGTYGVGAALPQLPIVFRFSRDLRSNTGFEIIAHRGGGRNADLLPASENSLEMLRLATRLGATGVEIDIQRTSDNELVLYHDATLNERLIKKNGMVGPIENYSFAQLTALVELKRGGKIPSLRQALHTIINETSLRFVWLDTKLKGSLEKLRQVQQEFMQLAAARGRQLQIVIGIPDEEVLKNFRQLPNFQNIPSLSELDIATTTDINATIWAPTWTLGLQNVEVESVQARGKKAFVWTLDSPERIQQFLNQGRFNGILSNQPMAVAFYYYAMQ